MAADTTITLTRWFAGARPNRAGGRLRARLSSDRGSAGLWNCPAAAQDSADQYNRKVNSRYGIPR